MMNDLEMRKKVESYAKSCSKLYTGGEKYFNEIDAKIKADYDLLLSFIQKAIKESGCRNVILSGGMYDAVMAASKGVNAKNYNLASSLYKIPGNLRKNTELLKCPAEFKFLYSNLEYIFVDDSFYSGKTYANVKSFIESAGGKVLAAYVFYDGSKEKKKDVHSLYRYYDEMQTKVDNTASSNVFNVEQVRIDSDGKIQLSAQTMKLLNVAVGDIIEFESCTDDERGECLLISKAASKEEEMNESFDLVQAVFNRVVGKKLSVDQVGEICDLLSDFLECLTEIESEG